MSSMGWNHIILEGFCFRKLNNKKNKYNYRVVSTEPFKTEKIKNPKYDSNYKVPKKPKYCKNKICNDCWENDCPYLATATVPDEDYEMFIKSYIKYIELKDEKSD